MSSIELATWNVSKGIDSERQNQIFDGIKKLGSQFIALSEAFSTTSVNPDDHRQQYNDIMGSIAGFAKANGYGIPIAYSYQDDPKPIEAPNTEVYGVVFSRPELNKDMGNKIRLGVRNALSLDLYPTDVDENIAIQVIAAHLDDRDEWLRMMAIDSLPGYLVPEQPKVIIGDLNAMHGDTPIARLLRTKTAKLIANNSFPYRARTITTRAVEMADGCTLATLEAKGFRDSDRFSQSTYKLGRFAVGQLDHIMVANSESMHIVAEQAKVINLKGSDHKAVSSVIHVDHKIVRNPSDFKPRI